MSTPPNIPDHTLRRVIGKGAYGEVWLARNVMGAPRAVKIIWRRQFDSDRPYEREFAGIQRYEPVSRTADGLVHVLHVGRNNAEGYFYYVMELADAVGEPVTQWDTDKETEGSNPFGAPTLSECLSANFPAELTPLQAYAPRTLRSDMKTLGRLPVADCLRAAIDVAGGLARLHERGLVHRDVKPGNIIFVEGRAKLADIGLVSRESEGRTFVGTEGYIPPEGPGSPAADLYALGMVLYEAVTGYPPDKFPKVPTEWFAEEATSDALEFHAVVLKCCEGAKERRYQNVEELQADLALLQSGQSVRHLRALEERVARWRRIGWVAGAGVAVAVMIALVAHWRASVAAESQAKEAKLLEQANHSLARAETAEREARQQLYAALLEQARATVRSGEMGHRVHALDAIQRAAAISNSVDLRREVVAALSLPDLKFERELSYGPEYMAKQLDPKFERIAVTRRRGPIQIYAVANGRLLATLPASTNLICYSILWSPDGRYLAANRDHDQNGYRSDIEVWDLKETPRMVLLIRDALYKGRAFHPTKPQFVSGGAGKVAGIDSIMTSWHLETGKELGHASFEATPLDLAFSSDGEFTAATYQRTDGWGASVHRAQDGAMVCSNIFTKRVVSLAWDPKGRSLALSDDAGAIHLMDARSGETRVLGRHNAEAVTTTFNADGRYLITGAWGRELACWDVLRRERAFAINVDSFIAQFRADGLACVTLTGNGVQLYSFERPLIHRELPEEIAPRARHAAFSDDGRWIAASGDQRLGVWDLDCDGPGVFADYAGDARPYWASNGDLFANRSRINECFRWRAHPSSNRMTSPALEQLPVYKPERLSTISVRSNLIAWTTARGSRVTDLSDAANSVGTWIPTARGINGVSPDGRWLAIYGAFTTNMAVYDLPELEPVAQLTTRARISGFSFSPLGDELAVSSNGQVEFWSTSTWEPTRMGTNFIGMPGPGVIFEPDGQGIWMARSLRNAGLFEAKTLQPQLPLPSGLLPLALTPDNKRLAVSVEGRRVQILDLPAIRQELARLGLDWKD